jgi:Ca2+/Na+ antiporter
MGAKNMEMEQFVSQLKKKDNFNLRLGQILTRFYVFMIGVYLLLVVVNPFTPFDPYHRISGLLFVLTFSWFAILFGRYQRYFREPDYSEPTILMLQKVVDRYRLTVKHFLQIIPPVVFAGAALVVSAYGSTGSLAGAWILLTGFIALIVMAAFAGYQVWRQKHKPLHDSALQMLQDLQG